jgi:hypothetical protein
LLGSSKPKPKPKPKRNLTGWLNSPFEKRKGNFVIRGPKGMTSMMDHMVQAFSADIEIRHRSRTDAPDRWVASGLFL